MKGCFLAAVVTLAIANFGFSESQTTERNVRRLLAGDWKFTPAQAAALNRTEPELLAEPIYTMLASAGIRLRKWSNSEERLGVKALHECRFVDLHHDGLYFAIALIVDRRPYSYVIQKQLESFRVAEVVNWGSKLTYDRPDRDYVLSLERLQQFCEACPNGFFPRIYDYENGQLVDVSNRHPEFYAKDFTKDIDIILSAYEGRSPSASPPLTGEFMIENWNRSGYYERVEAVVGLAEAMLKANRLFAEPVLPRRSFIRIYALLNAYSPANAGPGVRKREAGMFGTREEHIWEKTKQTIQDELLRYK